MAEDGLEATRKSNPPGAEPQKEPSLGPVGNGSSAQVSFKDEAGKDVVLTPEQAREFYLKGRHFEKKMGELKSDAKEYEAYKKLKETIANDPRVRKRFERAFSEPDEPDDDAKPEAQDPDDDDDLIEAQPKKRGPRTRDLERELRETRARQDASERALLDRLAQQEQRALADKIDRLVEKDETLSLGPKYAKQQILAVMTKMPDVDMDIVVAEVRNEIEDFRKKIRKLDESKEAKGQFPAIKGGGPVPPPQKPKFTGKDLDSGAVMRATLARMQQLG